VSFENDTGQAGKVVETNRAQVRRLGETMERAVDVGSRVGRARGFVLRIAPTRGGSRPGNTDIPSWISWRSAMASRSVIWLSARRSIRGGAAWLPVRPARASREGRGRV
jgi:hypothetical protein